MRSIPPPTNELNRRTRIRLALESEVDLRTLERHLRGEAKSHPLTVRAITEAAQRLGLVLP